MSRKPRSVAGCSCAPPMNRNMTLSPPRTKRHRDCAFCGIVAGLLPASIVYRDHAVTAFLDRAQVNAGHLLVVPNVHAGRLRDLRASQASRLFATARQLAEALRRSSLPCEGINLLLADGNTAGQTVPHVHLHVLPRYKNDRVAPGGLAFGKAKGDRSSQPVLKQRAAAIRKALKASTGSHEG